MGEYRSKPVDVIALQFTGDNKKEFEKLPCVKTVQGPYANPMDSEKGKAIEIWNDFCDFELYEGEWGIFYPNGRCEFMDDAEFKDRFEALSRWTNEGGK